MQSWCSLTTKLSASKLNLWLHFKQLFSKTVCVLSFICNFFEKEMHRAPFFKFRTSKHLTQSILLIKVSCWFSKIVIFLFSNIPLQFKKFATSLLKFNHRVTALFYNIRQNQKIESITDHRGAHAVWTKTFLSTQSSIRTILPWDKDKVCRTVNSSKGDISQSKVSEGS